MTIDLSTDYLGLTLAHPLVVSSCPLTGRLETLRQLEQHGAAAVVLPSLFQEQIEHEELQMGRLHDVGAESYGEAMGYFPELMQYNTGPEGYLELVEEAASSLSIPVIASLNGVDPVGFRHYARRMQDAGAAALELNLLQVPTSADLTSADVEARYAEAVHAVVTAVRIPVAVKLGAQVTSPAHLARQLEAAGARGLVVFNRFLEPDLDLETMEVVPRLDLSHAGEMRQALRWIAILDAETPLSLAATSGVQDAESVVKLLLVGADVVMTASALLRHGPALLGTLREGLVRWLEERGYESVRQMQGSMNRTNCPDPMAYERLNYMRALTAFTDQWSRGPGRTHGPA